ncbi:putative ABC transporter, ATP-binding/membrane protein [Nocardia nova SH22a]|uniref:Putative ABC transporter, ATP-binding/membrane protein n=1 Tax=Nocardia nova SH22a TaxID=1415166 RepID=W5TFS3_9NOCA|nr:ABC transporter ATP-binding protein [Nocardia nova]AHH17843.1 putative ABC transporter, ATP-binding/membrane protein [Nocardia nova SH22a]
MNATAPQRDSLPALLRRLDRLAPLPRTALLSIALLVVIAGGGRIVIPVTIQYALDHALLADTTPEARSHIVFGAVGVGVAAVLAAMVSSSVMNRRLIRIIEQFLLDLRAAAFARILRRDPADRATETGGDLVARVTNDLDMVTVYAQSGGVTLVQNICQMILALVVMAAYSWPLAVLVLIIGTLVPIAGRRLQRLVSQRFDAVRVRIGELYGGLLELLLGIDTIRGYGIEDRMRAGAERRIDAVLAAQRKTLWPVGFNMSIGEVASGLITAAVIVIGTAAGIGPLHASAGDIVAFLFLVTFFVRPMQFAVTSLADARNAEAGLRRVAALLDTPIRSRTPRHAALPPGPATVELSGVSFAYVPGRTALGPVDLRIRAGEHIAVVGETGCGKSTFAKLITRQLLPSAGRVALWDIDTAEIDDEVLARRVAIVPQDPFLFDRSIEDNIALGRDGASREAVLDVLERLGLREWIDHLPDGLRTTVGRRGEALSAGERQLVALARTALTDPDLLVLDEATSGVDAATDVRLQRALVHLTSGRTTLTIAHRLHSAEIADRILVFHAGQVVEDGPHEQLSTAGGRYARLHAAWAPDTADRSRGELIG